MCVYIYIYGLWALKSHTKARIPLPTPSPIIEL